jgi:hypothetical protein
MKRSRVPKSSEQRRNFLKLILAAVAVATAVPRRSAIKVMQSDNRPNEEK